MRVCDQDAHFAHDFSIVGLAEDSGAGDEDVGAGRLHVRDIVELHAALDLDVDAETATLQLAADAAHLVEGVRDELLAPEPPTHAHPHHHPAIPGQRPPPAALPLRI